MGLTDTNPETPSRHLLPQQYVPIKYIYTLTVLQNGLIVAFRNKTDSLSEQIEQSMPKGIVLFFSYKDAFSSLPYKQKNCITSLKTPCRKPRHSWYDIHDLSQA